MSHLPCGEVVGNGFGFFVIVQQEDLGSVRFNANEQRYAYVHDQGHKWTPHQSIEKIAANINRKNAGIMSNAGVKIGRRGEVSASTVRLLLDCVQRRMQSHPEEEKRHWDSVARPYDYQSNDTPKVSS